jgi:uracil-DNA glycosylase
MSDTILKEILKEERLKSYFKDLMDRVDESYVNNVVYPLKENIFKAFEMEEEVKVVILGQDPYHQPNQAQGLAFSTPESVKNPPSMINILKGIEADLGHVSVCQNGDLNTWREQGVFLLNTILTVQDSKPKSHEGFGWYNFTDNVIRELSNRTENLVFILWGSPAHQKIKLIDQNKHLIIKEVHPSPLSAYRGFFDSKQFSLTNKYLISKNKTPIVW